MNFYLLIGVKLLLREVICLLYLKIEYTTRIKEFISRRSSTYPYCESGAFFLTQVILSRKSFYLYDLVGWIPHPHRTDLVPKKILGKAPSICSRRKHQKFHPPFRNYIKVLSFFHNSCRTFLIAILSLFHSTLKITPAYFMYHTRLLWKQKRTVWY